MKFLASVVLSGGLCWFCCNVRQGAAIEGGKRNSLIAVISFPLVKHSVTAQMSNSNDLAVGHRVHFERVTGGNKPCARSGHFMVTVNTMGGILMFGGLSHGSDCLNDTWFFHAQSQKWEEVATTGPKPPPAFGQGCALLRNERLLFVYGGIGGNDVHFNSVHTLDIVERKWTHVASLRFRRLWGHSVSSVLMKGMEKLVIFGGMEGESTNDNVYIVDATSLSCDSVRSVRGSQRSVPADARMLARRRHGACVFRDTFIIVAGGRDAAQFFNDMWVYNVLLDEWTPLTAATNARNVRSYFDNPTSSAPGSCIRSAYAAAKGAQTMVPAFYSSMFPRTGVSMFCHGDSVFVFGGFFWSWEGSCSFDDLHVYDMLDHCWGHVKEVGPDGDDSGSPTYPKPTTMSSICVLPRDCDSAPRRWLAFGGRHGNVPTSAQYVLTLFPPQVPLKEVAAQWLRLFAEQSDLVHLAPRCRELVAAERHFAVLFIRPAQDEVSDAEGNNSDDGDSD